MQYLLHQRVATFFAIGTAASLASFLTAEPLMYEGFDIPAGEIHGTAGETSFGWRVDGGEEVNWWAWKEDEGPDAFYHGVTADGLTYPGLETTGGAFVFHNEQTQASNVTHRFIPGFLSYFGTSGQRWVSVLMTPKIDGDPENGGWFQFTFSDPIAGHNSLYMGISNNATRDQTVWSAGGERLYEGGVHGAKWSLSDVPVVDGETVFLVMLLDFDWKTAAWWVNPDPLAEDPGDPVAEFTMLTDLAVDRVMLRIFNNGPSQLKDEPDFEGQGFGADYTGSRIDEIRMGTTYASVTPEADEPPVVIGDGITHNLSFTRDAAAESLSLAFENAAVGRYRVERSTDLGATDPWTPVAGAEANPQTVGEAIEFVLDHTDPEEFFRIEFTPAE
ncbi:MAG: hypothetical protein JJU00_04365 [Opitutales bacterium]|nr:hypothetical protein [Opitutales bacterium]